MTRKMLAHEQNGLELLLDEYDDKGEVVGSARWERNAA
jgi:hypothetical protein